jgi:M6 family metalloprotease-like protein
MNRLAALFPPAAMILASCSGPTDVPNPATKLEFASASTNAVAGATIQPSIQVRVLNADGAIVTGSIAAVTITLTTQAGAHDAVLAGTLTRNAVDGVATFDDLMLTKAASGYTLTASATGLASATTGAFAVTPGVADRLILVQSPTTTVAGQSLSPGFVVRMEDDYGNAVTSDERNISVSITSSTGASGARLTGTMTRATEAGVATFDDLSIDRSGSAYTLTAGAPGLTGTATSAFSVLARVSVVSGSGQTGLGGFELGDSIVVEVQDPIGTPVVGQTVAWNAIAGSLLSSSSQTNGAGRAIARWRVADGPNSLTATAMGNVATAIATGLPRTACGFSGGPGDGFPPRDTLRFWNINRPLRVAALFIDFPDLTPDLTVAQMMTDIINPAVQLLAATTDGKLQLQVVPSADWLRMPENANDFRWGPLLSHPDYVNTVLSRFDPTYDFSTIDVIWIFRPHVEDPQPSSGVMNLFSSNPPAFPLRDGREMRSFATFGRDVHGTDDPINFPNRGIHIVAHEMGHVIGLPDLYAYQSAAGEDPLRYTGGWSFMGAAGPGNSWTAAERSYLGVLPDNDVLCPPTEPFHAIVTLRPIEETTGLRGMGLRETATKVTFIESRHALGIDAAFCRTGLLVYDVNGAAPGGHGPIQVRDIHASPPGPEENRCHIKWNAPAQVGDVINLGTQPVTVTVLSRTSDGAITVRVVRQ